MFKSNTPVVLLIFKRPEQTAKVFEVVRQVQPPKLLVVGDGPRPDKSGEAEKCSAARSIMDKVDWNCEVLTNFSDVNLGCKNRVSSGLDWVFSLVDEAIIIEDDCVPDPSFFRFCEELLERYRDVPQVMSITGENTHGYQTLNSSYYFAQYSFYWGWATWKRAWKLFDGNLKLWEGLRKTNWLSNLLQNAEATEYWSDIFEQTFNGFNSWGYGWTFACLVNQGLCVIANNNLISNIGFGEDAAHHTWSVDEIGNLPVNPIQFPLQHPKEIIRNLEADILIDKIRFSGRQKYRIARKLALRYLNNQEYKQSLNWFQQALELRPDLLGLNYGKAVCLVRMNKKNEAIDTLNHLLKSVSTHPKAKLLLDELAGFTIGSPLVNQIVNLEDVVCKPVEPVFNFILSSLTPQLPKASPAPTVQNASSKNNNITIFAIPKAFKGHINIIQRNAIISWTKLEPRPEIILFGEDEGTAEIAAELNLKHIPDVKCNQFCTPLLSDMFERTQQIATFDLVAYVNSDIILLQDFREGVLKISQQYDKFMAVGRRWDIDIIAPIDFANSNWSTELRQLIVDTASLHSVHGKDYFVFPKNLFAQIPEFAVGRATWDNWMVHTALERNYAVVDATQGIMAIHQNHDYAHLKGGKLESSRGKEAELNKIAGGYHFSGTIADATEQFLEKRVADIPRVSIVIATHNQANSLDKAIASVINQSYRDWEIILIDDGSTDNTRQLVEAYSQQVKYIYQDRQGIIAAYNRGIQEAQGELIGFLEADSWFLPDKLKHQVACFDARGSVEMVSSGWQIIDTQGAVVEEMQPWSNLPNLDIEELHIWKLWKLWQQFPLSAMMFRRRYLDILGGFNTELDYLELAKISLILRLALKGCLGSWLSQSTCGYLNKINHKITNPDLFAVKFELLLDNFFQHNEITDWMQVLKPEAKYNSLVFLAWLMHNERYFEHRDVYLKKSCEYNSQVIEQNWADSFTRFASEFGSNFTPQYLNNLAIL
jgi:glycosyltransferase involved in cell wall biosynthesis/tetratricopeptide (TPR) repeat protein